MAWHVRIQAEEMLNYIPVFEKLKLNFIYWSGHEICK